MTEVAVAAFAFLGIAILLAHAFDAHRKTSQAARALRRTASGGPVLPRSGFRSLRGLYFISGRQAACGRLPELTKLESLALFRTHSRQIAEIANVGTGKC
jgi:hypothetical protein